MLTLGMHLHLPVMVADDRPPANAARDARALARLLERVVIEHLSGSVARSPYRSFLIQAGEDMLELHFGTARSGTYTVMCLGAHCDDLEIGCSGTLMKLSASGMPLNVAWVVFSADDEREREARRSAEVVLGKVTCKEISIRRFPDGLFPSVQAEIKEYFETLKGHVCPDIIFTHHVRDLHQDHRVIGELTWNTFRDHLIIEYEIPKYDGDLGSPNVFVRLDESVCRAKVDNILASFRSQEGKRWFTRDLFLSLMRLRGMEANAASRYAEGFYSRKLVVG